MRNRCAAVVSLLGLLGSWPAASLAGPRQPTGQWHVQFDGVQCVGLREYGTADKPVTLALEPSPSGTVMRVIIITKGAASFAQYGENIRFDRDEFVTNALYYADESNKFRMVAINVPMDRFRNDLHARSIAFQGAPFTGDFAVSELDSVNAGLAQCLEQLHDRWNMGDEHASRIARQAVGSVQGVISSRDYPQTAIRRDQQGRVSFTLLIDTDGRIPDCGVDETSGVPFLDSASCYLVTHRARFKPAVGPDGQPVRSSARASITWRIAP